MGKKFKKTLVTILVIALLLIYVPYYVNTCSSCDELFFGPGYKANILADVLSENRGIICEDCAKIHHAASSFIGKDIDDYKNPIFVDPITLIKEKVEMFSGK